MEPAHPEFIPKAARHKSRAAAGYFCRPAHVLFRGHLAPTCARAGNGMQTAAIWHSALTVMGGNEAQFHRDKT